MDQQTVTMVVSGPGIGGTLWGTVLGQYLTRSWQREQWFLDRRKEEFRELLSAPTRSCSTTVQLTPTLKSLSDRQQQAMDEAEAAALAVIQDRILIAFEGQELNALQRWKGAVLSAKKPRVVDEFEHRFNQLNTDIIVAALKQIERRPREDLSGGAPRHAQPLDTQSRISTELLQLARRVKCSGYSKAVHELQGQNQVQQRENAAIYKSRWHPKTPMHKPRKQHANPHNSNHGTYNKSA